MCGGASGIYMIDSDQGFNLDGRARTFEQASARGAADNDGDVPIVSNTANVFCQEIIAKIYSES